MSLHVKIAHWGIICNHAAHNLIVLLRHRCSLCCARLIYSIVGRDATFDLDFVGFGDCGIVASL